MIKSDNDCRFEIMSITLPTLPPKAHQLLKYPGLIPRTPSSKLSFVAVWTCPMRIQNFQNNLGSVKPFIRSHRFVSLVHFEYDALCIDCPSRWAHKQEYQNRVSLYLWIPTDYSLRRIPFESVRQSNVRVHRRRASKFANTYFFVLFLGQWWRGTAVKTSSSSIF